MPAAGPGRGPRPPRAASTALSREGTAVVSGASAIASAGGKRGLPVPAALNDSISGIGRASFSLGGSSAFAGNAESFDSMGRKAEGGSAAVSSIAASTPNHTVLPAQNSFSLSSLFSAREPDHYGVSGILDELTTSRPERLPISFQKFEARAAELGQFASRQPISFDHQPRRQVSLSAVRGMRTFYAETLQRIDKNVNIQVGITPDHLSYYRAHFLLVLCEGLVPSCSAAVRSWIEREYRRFFASLPEVERRGIYAPAPDGLSAAPSPRFYHPGFSPDIALFEAEYYSSIRNLVSSDLVLLSNDSIYARTSLAQSLSSSMSQLSLIPQESTAPPGRPVPPEPSASLGSRTPSRGDLSASSDFRAPRPELSRSQGLGATVRSLSLAGDLTPSKAFELLRKSQGLKREARDASRVLKANQEDRQVAALVKVLLSPEFRSAQRIEVAQLRKRLQQVLIGEVVNTRSVLARAMEKYRWLSYPEGRAGPGSQASRAAVVYVDRVAMRAGL